MTNNMSECEYPVSKVRLEIEVEVSHETTDTDEEIKETASLRRGKGTVVRADIIERDNNSG